jgi:nucleotide-binding universal stress UspA family protein
MKVVVSADGGAEGRAARRWCVEHLGPGDEVVAVLGVDSLSEAMLSVSPLLEVADPDNLRDGVARRFAAALEPRHIHSHARVTYRSQAAAVLAEARAEHADVIVVGKRPHGVVGDAVVNETAGHLIHRPPCPVIVVPTTAAGVDLATAPTLSSGVP